MAAINADERVMEFFPATKTYQQTEEFVHRMQTQFAEKGFCYFAVDTLINGEFIGFIGLSLQTFESAFTPCIDIGWRLSYSAWNKGFATEGAAACLEYAFMELRLEKVAAIAPVINTRSIAIMEKTGMKVAGTFMHPLIAGDSRLRKCIVYMVDSEEFRKIRTVRKANGDETIFGG